MDKYQKKKKEKDFLELNLRELPYFRALLRAVEARFYQDYDLKSPVFDLGCGDGQFATIAFETPLDVGLDPWNGPIHQAIQTGGYHFVIQGEGSKIPFKDAAFSSAISNSVLEHIPDIEPVLKEMARILKPGSIFLFCVPNQNFLSNLSISTFFDRIHMIWAGNAYRKFFNNISRHQHCDPPEVWEKRMLNAGFNIEKWWHYFSPEALHVLEWGHYFGLPSLMLHLLSRRWIIIPTSWNLFITRAIVDKYYREDKNQAKGSYTFYVVRRIG